MSQEKKRVQEAIRVYDGVYKNKLDSEFGIYSTRVEVLENKYILPLSYQKWYQKYKDFEARPSDIWVISFPKSGTTWTQEMVWCIQNGLNSKGSDEVLMKRFPFFEFDGLLPEVESSLDYLEDDHPCKPGETWKILHNISEPRLIKSHLHFELLPSNIISAGAKIIYVSRDPRDVCVSYYYHTVKLDGFTGNFQDFFELFIKDLHFWSPYWRNVLDYWNRRGSPNLLFVRYEDFHEDLPKMIRKVAEFLGRSLTDDFVQKLAVHLSFSSMRSNKAVNNEDIQTGESDTAQIPFMRKGQVGDWKSHFTSENKKEFKKWLMENLNGTDFPYYQEGYD